VAVPEQTNPRYLQSITVVTLFFAALLGFGLNHLLETEHTEKGSIIADHRWGVFFVAVFIFLRFLTGSANHLWLEYVRDPRVDRSWWFELNQDDVLFTWDLAWLTLFGYFGVAMCYSKNDHTFFWYTAGLLGAAFIWSVLDLYLRHLQWRRDIGGWAHRWIWLNFVQLLFVGIVGLLAGYLKCLDQLESTIRLVGAGDSALGLLGNWLTALFMDRALALRLLIIGFVSAAILATDFYRQLRQLANPP
jgi:hypothetical protein